MSSFEPHDFITKAVIIGNSGVGKSSVLRRLTDGVFSDIHDMTIGVDFGVCYIRATCGTNTKMQIWDTAGQENFRSIARSYYRNAACVILVYDVCNRTSFDDITNTWDAEIFKHTNNHPRVILIGNKCDMIQERCVSIEEAQRVTKERKFLCYAEVSAKNGTGILDIFIKMTDQVLSDIRYGKINVCDASCGVKSTTPSSDGIINEQGTVVQICTPDKSDRKAKKDENDIFSSCCV